MSTIKILLLGFFTLAIVNINFGTNGSSQNIGCIESEKQALLQFKKHVIDDADQLASWVHHQDCCQRWVRVICHNVTGHVLELHLGLPTSDYDKLAYDDEYKSSYVRSRLGGKTNYSLLNLTRLNYLDLSMNDFGGISNLFGSMVSVRYLNLSDAGFGGLIPRQLGNLTNMQNFDLHGSYDHNGILFVEDLQWLAGVSGLKYLDMSFVDLSKSFDWLQTVNMLPCLKELHLSACRLHHLAFNTLLFKPNFSSLETLWMSEKW